MNQPTPTPRRRAVSAEEVLELYQRVKSSETIGLFDAAEALRRDDVATALTRLQDARTRYAKRYQRTIHSGGTAPATGKARARSEKICQAHALLVELEEALARQVKIRRAVPQTPHGESSARRRLVSFSKEFLTAFGEAASAEDRLEWVKGQFQLQPLVTECLQPHQTYLVNTKSGWHLLECIVAQEDGRYTFQDRTTQRAALLSSASLQRAAERGHAFELRHLPSRSPGPSPASDEQVVLDESELIVLWSVVRDTGLLPNASEITQVKKNEIRKRQFDRALQKMLLLQRSFLAASRAKRKAFARDLAYLDSQKQNLPLREIERRKLQIARETRLIERAEGHFTKVMNSLHALDSRRS